MREMALADLEQVAARLRNLHNRLERKTARNWTEQQIATETNVAYRTYQSWLGAKNENRDGTGYEKLARFYRRRLEDQSITRNWIVFGEQEQQRAETPDPMADLSEDQLDRIEGLLREMREMLGHLETADPKENS